MKIDRQKTTEFLSELLILRKLSVPGTHWAREVVFDYGTRDVKRLDFLHFAPENQMSVAGIEHGTFTAYEIKSCKADFGSGFGRNAEGDRNYFATTAECWNSIKNTFTKDYGYEFGVYVAVPAFIHPNSAKAAEWILDPTDYPMESPEHWSLHKVLDGRTGARKRSVTEMLFCMMRSRHA